MSVKSGVARLFEILYCLRICSGLKVSLSATAIEIGLWRIVFHHIVVIEDRLVVLAERDERVSTVSEGVDQVRIKFDRRVVVGRRLVLAARMVNPTAPRVGLSHRRIEPNGLGVERDRQPLTTRPMG